MLNVKTRGAALARDWALAAWAAGEPEAHVADLLLASRNLYLEAEVPSAAAVSAALSGLLRTERLPGDALADLDDAIPSLTHTANAFLLVLAHHAKSFCLARLGRPDEARPLLNDYALPVLGTAEHLLASRWLKVRTRIALGHTEAIGDLKLLFSRFVDNRRFTQALLVACDLRALYPSLVSRDEVTSIVCRLEAAASSAVNTFPSLPTIAELADLDCPAPEPPPAASFHRYSLATAVHGARLQLSDTPAGRVLRRVLKANPGRTIQIRNAALHLHFSRLRTARKPQD